MNIQQSTIDEASMSKSQAAKRKGKASGAGGRKNPKWGRYEHTVFISCCENAIAAGQREGRCFTNEGWEGIVQSFNAWTGRNWTQSALSTHWKAMRKDHTFFHKLLNCTGIEYDHRRNAVIADDHWWEGKVRIRKEYAKLRNMNCHEIYHLYGRLFVNTFNSNKYGLTPRKMGCKGGFFSGGYVIAGPWNDTIPVNAEMIDESDGLSGSGKLLSLGEGIRGEGARARESCPSCAQCIKELKIAGLLVPKSRLHMFALTFFTKKSNREGYAACDTLDEKFDWLTFSYEQCENSKNCYKNHESEIV